MVVSDTPRPVDGDGFVGELTEAEFAKCAGIDYCFVVVSDKVVETKEAVDEETPVVEDAVTPKRGRPAKGGK